MDSDEIDDTEVEEVECDICRDPNSKAPAMIVCEYHLKLFEQNETNERLH
jgi:hypothetical protein